MSGNQMDEATHILPDKLYENDWELVVPKTEPLDEPQHSVIELQQSVEPDSDEGAVETSEAGKSVTDRSQMQHICKWISLDSLKICAAVYPTVPQLYNHVKKHVTGSKSAGYTCWWQGCINDGHPFKQKDTLVNHLSIHTNELTRKNCKDHEEQDAPACSLKFKPRVDFDAQGTVTVHMLLRNTYPGSGKKSRSQTKLEERNAGVSDRDVNADVLEILPDKIPGESTKRWPLVVPKTEPLEDSSRVVAMDDDESEIDLPETSILDIKREPEEEPEATIDEVGDENEGEESPDRWDASVGYKTKMEPEVIINVPQVESEVMEEPNVQCRQETYFRPKICRWVFQGTLQICGKVHATALDLSIHASTHLMRKKSNLYTCWWYGCNIDGHPFRSKEALREHLYTHTNEELQTLQTDRSKSPEPGSSGVAESDPNNTCKFPGCNQSFARKPDLEEHQKGHRTMLMRQKPYQCSFPGCGRRFGNQSILKEHVTSHAVAKEEELRQTWREKAQLKMLRCVQETLELGANTVNLQPQVVLERVDVGKLMSMDSCADMEREVERIRARNQRTQVKIQEVAYQICKWESYRKGAKGRVCLQVIAMSDLISHIAKEHLAGCTEHVCLWQNCQLGEHAFRLRLELLSHLRQHLFGELSRCPKRFCGQWFDTKRELNEHIVNGHARLITNARRKIGLADGASSRPPNVKSAVTTAANNCVKYTACNVPDCEKVTANCLKKNHVVGYVIMCKFPGCRRTFASEKEFETHGVTHVTNSQRRFEGKLGRKQQDECDSAAKDVAKKIKIEDECEEMEVGREVETTERLRASVQMCKWTEEKNPSDVCLKVFTVADLMDHIVKDHVAQTDLEHRACWWLNCDVYGMQFLSRDELVSHVQCHEFSEKFRCTVEHCRRWFSCQLDLEQHRVSHARKSAVELQRMVASTRAAARRSRATKLKDA